MQIRRDEEIQAPTDPSPGYTGPILQALQWHVDDDNGEPLAMISAIKGRRQVEILHLGPEFAADPTGPAFLAVILEASIYSMIDRYPIPADSPAGKVGS